MRAALTLLFDALVSALAALAVLIALSGGGTVVIGDAVISAHSVGNPLLVLLLLAAVRLAVAPNSPFLAIPGFTPDRLARRARALFARLTGSRPIGHALAIAGAVAGASLALKAGIAWSHPGFFGGDDVEIHEMTLGVLWGRGWPIWELRSAVYPMTFIYPVQWLLSLAGVSDVGTLVLAGRLVVACVSSVGVVLLFVIAREEYGGRIALLAATMLAFNHVTVTFGASELPRPVAAVLVLAAYGAVLRPTSAWAALAGALVGAAAALRFSEALFIVPGVMHLATQNRWRHAAVFAVAVVATAAALQAMGDTLYWGSPFASARHVADYTLVRQQSSRGFEPMWHYVASVPSWFDWTLAGLAMLATARGAWRPALWAWTPLALLSLLPHKEARYLVPAMPFVCLLAARGLADAASFLRSEAPKTPVRMDRLTLLLVLALGASVLHHVSRLHTRPDDGAIALARRLAERPSTGVAAEQLWRLGGRLYLDRAGPLRDLDPARLRTKDDIVAAAIGPDIHWILIRGETCTRTGCTPALEASGFAADSVLAGTSQYVVFERIR